MSFALAFSIAGIVTNQSALLRTLGISGPGPFEIMLEVDAIQTRDHDEEPRDAGMRKV